jgi:hypothetical protein
MIQTKDKQFNLLESICKPSSDSRHKVIASLTILLPMLAVFNLLVLVSASCYILARITNF